MDIKTTAIIEYDFDLPQDLQSRRLRKRMVLYMFKLNRAGRKKFLY